MNGQTKKGGSSQSEGDPFIMDDGADELMFEEDITTQGIHANEADAIDSVQVPGYTIIKKVGAGAMSTLLLAKQENSGLILVLKVFFTRGVKDPSELRRFVQEYDIISSIRHPNIVQVYERAFGSNFAYIAMEYLPAGTLRQKISRNIPTETAIEYLRQIASGLAVIHEAGIIHRDLKPGNLLLKTNGILTITDFGISKIFSGNDADLALTTGLMVGTPYYMSPEQGNIEMRVDFRSDIYSLGVIFFQMLTGERPYTAKSMEGIIQAHTKSPIPKLPANLSKYQPLLDGMLEKKPEERFQKATDIIDGIEWITKKT